MAVGTLNQVIKSLNGTYNPQVNLIRQRQSAIPQTIAAEETALGAKKDQAFGDILGGARQRGLGFAGIPLQEQAKYASTDYLPALARLKQSGIEQATSLEEAILGIRERQTSLAQQIREGALSRAMQKRQMAEDKRQFNLNYKLSERTAGSGGGGGNTFIPTITPPTTPKQAKPKMVRKKDGGYAFTDPSGRPISAAAYSLGTGIPFRQLLQQMANKGDRGAKRALGFVGDDYGFDAGKIGKNQGLFNSLTWGIK